MTEFTLSSIFGELTKNVQIRFEAISELNKRLFDNVIYRNYLDWDVPTIGLDFEEIIGQYNITVAAPTIGINSKDPILGAEGLNTLRERIIKHALTKPMTMQNYRKILQLLDSKSISDKAKTQKLVDLMWGEVKDVVGAIEAKLDYLFLKGLSNKGVVTLDTTNNPEGGVHGSISYNQPASNIATSTLAWTAGNHATVNPFEDIQGVIDAAQDKVIFEKILIAPAVLAYIRSSAAMKKMIFGSDKSASILTTAALNEYMRANNLPVFEEIRRQVRIQEEDGTTTVVNPWTTANLVFIPSGKLGVIKCALADNEIRPEAGVAYSNYGNIRVSQWGVGETQNSNSVEFTKAEALALPVITEMDGIYTLDTKFA